MPPTATGPAEYSEHGLAPFGANGNDDGEVATAMFFGIQTDTDDFAYATPADHRAAAYLKPFVDAETLSRVGRRAVSAEAAGPYRDRLLRLPRFLLVAGNAPAEPEAIRDGLTLTGYFLRRHLFASADGRLPPARDRLADRLA